MLDTNLEGIVKTSIDSATEDSINVTIGGEDLLQLFKDINGEKVRITIEELE